MNIPDFRKKYFKDFEALQAEFDTDYCESNRMWVIVEKQLQLSYRPLIKNLQESNEVTALIHNLTTKLLVLKLTSDIEKDVAKLTNPPLLCISQYILSPLTEAYPLLLSCITSDYG